MKKLRGNQAKFMTKELRKAIMDRSRFKNKYLKWPSRENFLAYKKAKNICNSLNKKAKKDYFKKATADGVMSNRGFWNTVKPFLTSKGFLQNDNISINVNGNTVEDEQKSTKEFNSYYMNIVKTTSGKLPTKLENNLDYINNSLRNISNNIGPSIEPCVTPDKIFKKLLQMLLILTHCLRFLK